MARPSSKQKNTLKNYFRRGQSPAPRPMSEEIIYDTIVVAQLPRSTPGFPSEQAFKKRRLSPASAADSEHDSSTDGAQHVPHSKLISASEASSDGDTHVSPEHASTPTRPSVKSVQNGATVSPSSTHQSFVSASAYPASSPSASIPFGSQQISVAGSSRDTPLVIRSSQSDEDFDLNETIVPSGEPLVSLEDEEVQRDPSVSDTASQPGEDSDIVSGSDESDTNKPPKVESKLLDSESDSDFELEDLSTLFALRKNSPGMKATAPETPLAGRVSTRSGLRSSTRTVKTPSSTLPYTVRQPAKPSVKFSLSALVKQNQRDAATEARIAEAKAELARTTKKSYGQDSGGGSMPLANDEARVESAIDEHEGLTSSSRIVQAMQRVEAQKTHITWHFFEPGSEPSERPTWPFSANRSGQATSALWMESWHNASARDQAFRTGCAVASFPVQDIPPELMSWTMESMLTESDDSLGWAYTRALEAHQLHFTDTMSIASLKDTLMKLGARPLALNVKQTMDPVKSASASTPISPSVGLIRYITFLGDISHSLETSVLTIAIQLLARMCADTSVVQSQPLYSAVVRTLESLTGAIPVCVQEEIMTNVASMLFSSIANLTVQQRVMQGLPPTTENLACLRRRLALAFLLCDASILTWPTSPISTDEFELKLESRIVSFLNDLLACSIHDTDYKALTATTYLLDVAIDDGFARPETNAINNGYSEAEKAFDKRVDALSKPLSALAHRILDSGASHMMRAEAKSSLQRLLFRLELVVRTRRKPKQPIWGSNSSVYGRSVLGGDTSNAQVSLMKGYLGRETSEGSRKRQAEGTRSGENGLVIV